MAIEIPAWFDVDTYMANKLAQVQKADPDANWTPESLAEAFVANGFSGAEGAYNHFLTYGMNEDVSPNALFNVEQYYVSKTAEFYDKNPADVSALEIATVKDLIIKAYGSAWAHYDANGFNELDVNPSNDFDAAAYMQAKLELMQAEDPKYTMEDLQAAFAENGYSPLEHFLVYAGKEGEVQQMSFPVPEGERVPGLSGETFNLTPDVDNIQGTANSDLIIGNTQGGETTFTSGDSIDGGAGVDTLRLYTVDGVKKGEQTVKNVEQLESIAGKGEYVVSGWEGLEKATFKGGEVSKVEGNTALTEVVLDGVLVGAFTAKGDGITDVAVKNVEKISVTVDNSAAKLALNVTLENVGKLDKDGNPDLLNSGATVEVSTGKADTLNVTGNGTLNVADLSKLTDLTAMTISGEADFATDLTALTKLKSVDGSAATGDLDLGTLMVTEKVTVATGAGDDTLTLGTKLAKGSSIDMGAGDDVLITTVGNLNKDAAINGGDGEDALVFTGAATFDATADKADIANLNAVKGFEVLGVIGAELKVDASLVNFSDFLVMEKPAEGANPAVAGKITLTNAHDDSTVAFMDGESTGNTIKMADMAHTLNLSLEGDENAVSNVEVSLTGVEKLTIDSTGEKVEDSDPAKLADDNNVLALTSESTANVTLTGDQDLSLTLTSGAAKLGFNVDATAFDAKLDVTGSDNIDTIMMGAQGGIVTASKGADTITFGAGKDTFVAKVAAGANGADIDTINGFTSGTDVIKFGDNATTAGTTETVKIITESKAGGADLLDALTKALGAEGTPLVGNHAYIVTLTGENAGTYAVLESGGTTGKVDSADTVVHLAGVNASDLAAGDFMFHA